MSDLNLISDLVWEPWLLMWRFHLLGFLWCMLIYGCLIFPLLYVSTISDNIVCSLGTSNDDRFSRMSSKNRSLLMSLNFLYLISLVVGLLCCTSIVESMKVWLDNMYPLVTDFMDVSSWSLISKSKVCPDLCIGHWTWLVRLKLLRKSRNVMISGSVALSMCMLKSPISSNLPRSSLILLSMMSIMSLQNCKTLVEGSLSIRYRFITVPANLISNVLISIVLKLVLSLLVFFTEILSLYTKARPPPCLTDMILYSCGPISLILLVSTSDLIHVSLIAQISIRLLVTYCWKSRTLLLIDLAFMWEIFIHLDVNLFTGIACRLVWSIVDVSDFFSVASFLLDEMMEWILWNSLFPALDLLYGCSLGCFLVSKAIIEALVSWPSQKLLQGFHRCDTCLIDFRNVDEYILKTEIITVSQYHRIQFVSQYPMFP